METLIGSDHRFWIQHIRQDSRIYDKAFAYATDSTMPGELQEKADILLNLVSPK